MPVIPRSVTHSWETLSIEQMRARGSAKWSTPDERRHGRLIGAFVAEMDFPVAEEVAAAVRDCADTSMFGYLPRSWRRSMQESCSAFWADRFGWAPAPDRVRPVADVLEGFAVVVEHLVDPGAPIVVPVPAYHPFLELPARWHRSTVRVAMGRDVHGRRVLDLDAIEEALTPGALLVLTNPHNPCGRVFSRAELAGLADVVERRGARVFSDEVHAPLVFRGHRHVPYASVSEAAAAHSVTAASASKAWNLPGLKCGQLFLTADEDRERWRRHGGLPELGASTPGVAATIAAYRNGRAWLDGTLSYLEGNRAMVASADLPGVAVTVPEGTYLVWMECQELALEEPVADFFLREAGVVLADGAESGQPGAARLNIAMGREVLAEALDRIRAAAAMAPGTSTTLTGP